MSGNDRYWGPSRPNLPPWLQATGASTPDARAANIAAQNDPQLISLPRHLYPPEDVQTLDMRIERSMDPSTSYDFVYSPQKLGIQGMTYITHYAIANDGLLEQDYSFLPLKNNKRIYPYHGNPQNDRNPGVFLISLGLAPDLSNIALIPGFVTLQPEDTLIWRITNSSAVATAMGVRIVGYVDPSAIRKTQSFGG